jgi:CHAD domain-containing protein
MSPFPARQLSIEELCVKHGNEQAHTAHVAALALSLFDATAGLLAVPAEDRPLLEAACRLHEIGYGVSPRRHARAGYEIVRSEGLQGFTSSERNDIAAAIYLHPARSGATADRLLERRLRAVPRARRLAAYLRIADGLDAAHLQDAAIVAVQKTARTICLRVACHASSPGLAQAERKADFWSQVFPIQAQFVRAVRRPVGSGPLLTSDLPVIEGGRRLLYLGFSSLLANVHGALDGTDREALHKARVGIRRMRAVLRAFRKPLESTSAARIDRDLQHLNAVLGTVRDLDVWIDLLTGKTLQQQLAAHPHGKRYIDHQVALRRLQQATVRRYLGGSSFAALQARIGHLLRIELPQLVLTSSAGSLGLYSRRILVKNLRQALDLAKFRNARSLEKLHRLRIALRRVRYLGAAFAEILGPSVSALVKRIHRVEAALGRLRDTELASARIRREGPAPPRLLVLRLEHRRKKAVTELVTAWQKLAQPGFLAGVRRRLES